MSWTQSGQKPPSLEGVLEYARSAYASHTDWFLHHRDSGLRSLGTILTAEFAVLGAHFYWKLSPLAAASALALLVLLTFPLVYLAVLSCRKAYTAALEHAALINKAIHVAGLDRPVGVTFDTQEHPPPLVEDQVFFVPRYVRDSQQARTTREFVEHVLKKRDTTLFTAKIAHLVLGGAAVLVGIGGIVIVSVARHGDPLVG